MEVKVRALTKNVRISPEKARQVSRLIQGKSVQEALAIVELSPRKAARLIGETLRSAVANAENNHGMDVDKLYVSAISADPGPMLKRARPRAQGRSYRINKRTSHITLVLKEKE